MSVGTRLQGRLDRLGLEPEQAARVAGVPTVLLHRILLDQAPLPRGQRLVKLADALETSVSYLVGLDPDTPVPPEFLQEDQGALGLLAVNEETILRAYRRLDMSSRAALLRVVLKMSPEPEEMEKKPLQRGPRG